MPASSTDSGLGDQRLWTPWRMRYVGGGAAGDGCVFCRRWAADDDVRSLILHRGERAFAILNLFPYNTGHLMLVPVAHVPGPETADAAALAEIALLLPATLRALRRTLNCDGFNVGLNVGAIAGAGVADHLHQHVVPRWQGDANFMPILASTMVLPELLPVTYAKLRAEFARELNRGNDVACVVLADADRQTLIETAGGNRRLPTATADPDTPLWRAAGATVAALVGPGADLIGWAGPARAGGASPALTFRLSADQSVPNPPSGARWLPLAEIDRGTTESLLIADALSNLAPTGGPE